MEKSHSPLAHVILWGFGGLLWHCWSVGALLHSGRAGCQVHCGSVGAPGRGGAMADQRAVINPSQSPAATQISWLGPL